MSFDSAADLNALQADTFILATLMFEAAGVGTSALSLTLNSLGAADGLPLATALVDGAVTVAPESATVLVVGSGVVALILGCRRRRPS